MSETFTISDLAEQFDLTPRAIRFYEDKRLLTPTREGTKRVFTDRDRVRLKLIVRGKRLGFTLDEIRETFELYDSSSGEQAQMEYVLEVITQHRDILLQQQDDILQVLDDMKGVERRIRKKLHALETSQ